MPRRTKVTLATLGTISILAAACAGTSTSPASSTSAPTATGASTTRSAPPSQAASATAAASPGGSAPDSSATWLAYQSYDGANHIRVVRADGSGDRQVGDGSHPDWSPDGEWIAYQVDDRDIWIVRFDGTGARRVFGCADPCAIGDSAAWSPDGRELAFMTADAVGDRAPTGSIVAVDVSSGRMRTLLATTGPDYPAYPRWSPDGASIVVSIQRFATTKVSDCAAIGTAIGIVDLTSPTPKPR